MNGFVNGDTVYYFKSLADVAANNVSTMTVSEFSAYSVQGYIEGALSNGIISLAENASLVISHDYMDVTIADCCGICTSA